MCQDEKPVLDEVTDSQKQDIQAILDLVEESGKTQGNQSASILTALHLVVSAIDGKKVLSHFGKVESG